jgi:predicted DNA-binding transcriptional regulator AlpA
MDSHAAPPSQADHQLIDIADIRRIFRLGRTAAYERTHRPEFPDPVAVSPRCYRWWASEVMAFTATLRRESIRRPGKLERTAHQPRGAGPPRITGTVRAARGSEASS